MRSRRRFRPWVLESLEDRVVLSEAVVAMPPALGRTFSLPVEVRNNGEISQAFTVFVQDYERAVVTVLLAPDPDGTINPAANRDAFDAQVTAAVQELSSSIASTLTDQGDSQDEIDNLRQALLGNNSSSLLSQLEALTIVTILQ